MTYKQKNIKNNMYMYALNKFYYHSDIFRFYKKVIFFVQ